MYVVCTCTEGRGSVKMADWKDVFSRLENKIAAKDYDEILKLLNQLIVSSLELQVR